MLYNFFNYEKFSHIQSFYRQKDPFCFTWEVNA